MAVCKVYVGASQLVIPITPVDQSYDLQRKRLLALDMICGISSLLVRPHVIMSELDANQHVSGMGKFSDQAYH